MTKDKTEIIKEYLVKESNANFDWQPSYNIAPAQTTPVLLHKEARTILPMQWGLIPVWAKDKKIGYKMINARSESLSEKRSYAPLLKNHRCIVITDGYYEWKKSGHDKQPFYIYRENRNFISMAGLWSQWQSDAGKILNTYTVITTEPQQNISHIHNRMPAIISPENLDTWLNHEKYSREEALTLLKPLQETLQFHPVSKFMNTPANNSPRCIEKFEFKNLSLF